MRPSLLILLSVSLTPTAASWFSSDKPALPYTTWSTSELTQWLNDHSIPVSSSNPSQSQLRDLVKQNWNAAGSWTHGQYDAAQRSFSDLRDSSFEAWDESRLRDFLLQHGIVAPKSTKEELILLAKDQYRAYSDAAGSLSNRASTAIYGDRTQQASKSITSFISQATSEVERKLDDSKDYVYSTWDDNRLRSYLIEHGVLESKTQAKRNQLLASMKNAYAAVVNPIWEAWSTSYIHDWLINHNIIQSDAEKNRAALAQKMRLYYYDINGHAWDLWSDSELKTWLVDHDIIKSDAQVQREKMLKLVTDNYSNAKDTFWSAWTDSQIRDWLVQHNYLAKDSQLNHADLMKLADDKYHDTSARTADYLTWPDARLRTFLRENGMSEEHLPTSRPSLLQETRIRYVQSKPYVSSALSHVSDLLYRMFAVIARPFGFFTSRVADSSHYASDAVHEGADQAAQKVGESKEYVYDSAGRGKDRAYEHLKGNKEYVGQKGSEATGYLRDRKAEAVENAGETIERMGQKVKTEL